MATEDLLQAEARERPRMAIVAGIAAVFTLLGSIVGRFVGGSPPDNLPSALLFYHDHQAVQYISGACSTIGAIAIAFVLDFLFRATRARKRDMPAQIRPLPFVGGFGVAIFTIVYQIMLGVNVTHFATHGSQTYEEARKAIDAGVPPAAGLVVQLALAVAIVLISVNAMRVGLLTRFMGYLGVISGALFVLAFVPIPIVQVYWLGALAALFLGRAPNGLPPAWETGVDTPWPTPAEMREQRVREAEARRGEDSEPTAAAGEVEETAGAAPAPTPAASRRKRKKRR